jgi:hypothetical protein
MMDHVMKGAEASIESLAGKIATRKIDPRTAAEQLISGSG